MSKRNAGDQPGRLEMPASSGSLFGGASAPQLSWSELPEAVHFAQFYESDEFLVNTLSGYIGTGLSAGEAVIVVGTPAHRAGLERQLLLQGLDLQAARAAGQYSVLDAAECLARFMVHGQPDGARFVQIFGELISQSSRARRRVRVFGEMVALLWREGNYAGAIRLEQLWNQLHTSHRFSLCCGYPVTGGGREVLVQPLSSVCAEHSHIIPAESYTTLRSPDERFQTIVLLQQKARALEAEIAERRAAEEQLRVVKHALELQVADLRRLHELSSSLTSSLDIEAVLQEVLRAALEVHNTTMGVLSLCDPDCEKLNLKAHSGLSADFVREIEAVPPGGGACGTCYQQRRRVVVEDIELDPIFAAYRQASRRAGLRACHSTPLITREGRIIGVLSVHFDQPRRPSEREIHLMDLYARMAADFIENARLHYQLQQELEQRKQLLIREQLARAEAESVNRMKDEFLATVSHELRTPLTSILGWAQRLRGWRRDEASLARGLEIIEHNAKVQAQLVEDILDVSRMITGKLRLNIEPVDALAVINAAIDSVQLAAESRGLQLEVLLEPAARHVLGDADRLQQVLWNLLSNAIKFTPSGGRVEVRLERAGAQVQISVSDTGEGIDPDFLPFIFDRFRQADGTSTRSHSGLGLGLAIVRHLVELHGGTVQVDSAGKGQGACFSILLPPARAGLQIQRRETVLASADPAALLPFPSLQGVQVLVVDDDEHALQLLVDLLAECGATVQPVTSTAEALAVLRMEQPHVLVSDLAKPDADGYALIAGLRALDAERGRQTPAVALTAYAQLEDRVRALAAGYDMFVPTPVAPDELIAVIASLAESDAPGSPGS